MKLLIIEDEPDSLLGMKAAAESIQMNFAIYTSNHADSATKIIRKDRPDLIVTDIMLPGMTGLDLIERYTGSDYQPKVIVVSGHNDFEYARRSIRIGVVDYLLKPFSTQEFIDKLRKSMLQVEAEQIHHLQLEQQKNNADIGMQSMRTNYLIDFCFKKTPLEEHLYHRLRVWELEWLANQSFIMITMDTKGFPDGKPINPKFSLQTFAIGNIVQDVMKDYASSILFKDPKNRWVLIMNSQEEHIAKLIVHHVEKFHKISLAIGISSQKFSFEDIHAAYNESIKALRIQSLSNEVDVFYNEAETDSDIKESLTPREMATLICQGEEDLIKQGVRKFIRQTVLFEEFENREDIVRKMMSYLSHIHEHIRELTSKEIEEIPMKVWESLDDCKTLEEFERVLIKYFGELNRDVTPPQTNALIERAIHMISSRYMEDLSLQLIADELYLHPVWLSQSFKKEVGQTYMDFLTETRIERAKELLRETSLKVYEIAEAVGYHDLQHFGNIFKKRTGQTPKEYRYGK